MIIVFVLIAAALVLAALAVVILPLMRATPVDGAAEEGDDSARLAVLADGMRELNTELEAGTLDRSEYDEAKAELERQALDADAAPRRRAASAGRTAWAPALVVGIALPLLAVVLYVANGQPAAIWGGADSVVAQHPGAESNELNEMISMLKQRLQQDGGDAQGWTLLARAYRAAGQSQDSVDAYEKAVGLDSDNADLLIEYANTVAVLHNRNLRGKPQRLIDRALKLDPDNLNALALAGAAALQRGESKDAVRYWTHLKSLLPADSPGLARIDELIARAQGKQPAAVAEAAIHGTVTVSDALAGKITAGDTLFIFARAPNGPPMPLAVVRQPAPQFPATFTLDDSRAMTPDLHLSQFPSVNIVARLSRSGSATLQPGDLEGHINSVALGSKDVQIVIDHRVGG